MSLYPNDIAFAYLQLGLYDQDAYERGEEILSGARSYRYATKARVAHVTKFVDFLNARQKFGSLEMSFTEIRRIYHKRARALHPDLNQKNASEEDQLKALNAAYAIVDNIYREAQKFFEEDISFQERVRQEARQETLRENPSMANAASAASGNNRDFAASKAQATGPSPHRQANAKTRSPTTEMHRRRYVAASVPRHIRTSRLFYLSRSSIIGSKLVKPEDSFGVVYDIIMLPENEFLRARYFLGSEGLGAPALRLSGLTPAYIPVDRKEVSVPLAEKDPQSFAKAHFLKEFGLWNKAS